MDSAQVLLNELFHIAPLSQETAEALKAQGWESFFSFRPFERNGAANGGDIQLAIEAISKEAPQSLRDWNVVCAKPTDVPPEEHIHELLKKKTEQRLNWEKDH